MYFISNCARKTVINIVKIEVRGVLIYFVLIWATLHFFVVVFRQVLSLKERSENLGFT